MARRKITVTDWLRGAGASLRNGDGMNPLRTQRYVNAAHDERVARMGHLALSKSGLLDTASQAYRSAQQQKGRDIQYDDGQVAVKVKNGYSNRYDQYTTDIILIDRQSRKEHLHIVYGDDGRTLHEKWTENR
jgi:hypothetical protein